jgi:hypothetical protein
MSKWVDHVKETQKKLNISYKEALKEASKTYTKEKEKEKNMKEKVKQKAKKAKTKAKSKKMKVIKKAVDKLMTSEAKQILLTHNKGFRAKKIGKKCTARGTDPKKRQKMIVELSK